MAGLQRSFSATFPLTGRPKPHLSRTVLADLAGLLTDIGTLQSLTVEQYWKIPEYFGALLIFKTRNDHGDPVGVAATALGTGWQYQSAREAIWNNWEGCTFKVVEARWAHIELQ